MKARLLVPLVAVLLTPVVLAACGGGGSGAEDGITEAIEAVATKSDPKSCTEFETLRFAEQNDQAKGEEATEACEKEAEAGREEADAVTVSDVSVEGEKAAAQVEFEGGPFGSQAIEVALVEEDGGWKLDRIEGFAKYDGKALGEAFEAQFAKEPGGLTPKQASCIVGKIAGASRAQAEKLFLGGSSKGVLELSQGCG